MRGGARPGAGRKATKPHKNMTLSVPNETVAQAQALRKAGVKVNMEVAFEIRRLYNLCVVPDLEVSEK